MLSMTGFGSAQAQIEGVEYAIEIRSVNHRYLKTVIKLPETWSHAEAVFEGVVRKKITRGSVTLKVRMRLKEEMAAAKVNVSALRSYISQLELLQIEGDLSVRIELGSLLQLPGVCEPPAAEEICTATRGGLMELLGKCVDGVMEMRTHEGEKLKAELLGRCDEIDESLATVQERSPDVVKEYHERLSARVAELIDSARADIDGDILAREVAIFAERSDIAEEISRLKGHLGQFRQAADSPEPSGRKLDFIAQEMLREANTMASKSNDSRIGQAVVDIKTAIDRIKEQAANVE